MAKEAKALQKFKEKEARALEKIKEKDEKKRKKLEIQAANGKFYDEEIVCIMDQDLALRCPSLLEGAASQDGCTEKFEVRPSKEEEEMVVPYSGTMRCFVLICDRSKYFEAMANHRNNLFVLTHRGCCSHHISSLLALFPFPGAVWWVRRPITNQCNETEIKKAVAVVIDDATMFLDSIKDRSSPPNDYPGLEKAVNRLLACVKGRFDRVMLFLQGDKPFFVACPAI